MCSLSNFHRFILDHAEDTYSKTEQVDNNEILVRIMDTCDKEGKDPERSNRFSIKKKKKKEK